MSPLLLAGFDQGRIHPIGAWRRTQCGITHDMNSSFERSPQTYARACGLIYLAIIALGMFGELIMRGVLVAGRRSRGDGQQHRGQ
ncbi:MAG: hypothetical protein FJ196_03605 [Gammaproteobacteria bacterium]|nr:hypothetical protein [Gammaproteobacteria bacterium]